MHYEERNSESIISQNKESHKMKSFMQKLIVISIPMFPANLTTFEENIIFYVSFLDLLDAHN